ncbi:MAG: YqaJ viral recombinase family protein [Phycisphaeraceae bacterium]|nr:YqaJ viral recombinase family protein [Phycisphaeraceae bacterium]
MSAKIVKLVQGSPDWHAHRATYRNASETPAVLGVSPWVTPYQLWLQRSGRGQVEVTKPMLHGTQLEPLAREAYEKLTGHVMQPLVLVDGDYSASLDGITLDGGLILEIKSPFKGRDSDLWRAACEGKIPEHYRWQIETQLMVSGAEVAHLYVFDGQEGILVEQRPKREDWPVIEDGWEGFMRFIAEDLPPPLTDRDTLIRTDADWLQAAEAYAHLKAEAEAVSARLDEAKARLIGLVSHTSEKGAGVQVTKYWKAGNVDYKKVPELAGVELEKYRGPAREEVRVSLVK